MKSAGGRLSNYQIRATTANHDSTQSSAGNCIKQSFLVGERNLLEVCDAAVWGLHVPADPGSAKHEVLWLDALRPVEPEPRLLQGNGFLAASERIASAARHVARAGDGYR